jgi:hypothetical protein
MVNEMVLRSVYLRPSEDAQLRQLAHELNVTKSDLIRSAISVKLRDWLETSDEKVILNDVEHGRRTEAAIRSGRTRVVATRPVKAKEAPARQPQDPAPAKPAPSAKAGKEKKDAKDLASAHV